MYESFQKEALAKCCNGYVRLFAPLPAFAQTRGYDPWGNWHGKLVFVPETATAEIERIRALGPIEARATVVGDWPAFPQ